MSALITMLIAWAVKSVAKILESLSGNSFTKNFGGVMISLIQEAAQTAQSLSDKPVGLTTQGWIFMSIAWTAIISVAVFCYRKILQKAFERRQRQLLEPPPLTQEVNHEKAPK